MTQDKSIEPFFLNKVVDKSQLRQLIIWAFRNYGIARASNMADTLKDLGFLYATKAGISLSLEDLRIPPAKNNLLKTTIDLINDTDTKYRKGEITAVERFQKVIDTWNSASDTLKKQVIKYFTEKDPLNSIYMMAFSGARANISQVRQLVGMRGLMADPQGQIIDLPISSNFREGLTITDYFISSYGARKGLVDTALRTADSGYLTRRLVDVAQDVIIREADCNTSKGIVLESMIDNRKTLVSLHQALIGRVLAEDLFNPAGSKLVAKLNTEISPDLANEIISLGISSVLVRSPITCESIKSVCQSCYGWNLAHGRIVDLGEAVGIIAAQSIGEPGTQLTMRTFHTGGVFTGELAQTVISSSDCQVEYPSNIILSDTRTRHGDHAFLVEKDIKLKLLDFNKKQTSLSLVKGSLLFVKHLEYITSGQVIAEYPISNRLITEKAQKAVLADFSGSIYLMDLSVSNIQSEQQTFKNVIKGGVIWILAGHVFSIPYNTQLIISENDFIDENHLIGKTEFVSRYEGRVRILKKKQDFIQDIVIITSSKTYINIDVLTKFYNGYTNHFLITNQQDKFILKTLPNQTIVDQQLIAELITNIYRTNTGGIIKYLDLSVSDKKVDLNSKKDYYDIVDGGYVLWIGEETHEINKDISLLLVSHGQLIDEGTEIVKNIFTNSSGIVDIIQKEGIVREIIIKPGILYPHSKFYDHKSKSRGFLKPGEIISNDLKTDKLVYWEYFYVKNQSYTLIRPVIVYSIPSKTIQFKYSADSFNSHICSLKLVKRIYFRDGERVKSVSGIDIVKTYLIAELNKDSLNLKCTLQLNLDSNNRSISRMRIVTMDKLSLKDENNIASTKDLYTRTRLLVTNNQYIKSGTVVAQTELFSSLEGQVVSIQKNKSSNPRILLITSLDTKVFSINNNQNIKVNINDLIYAGDEIATNIISYISGQVISIRDNQITVRLGQPYLISEGSFLHVNNQALIQRGENIATLIFERVKTGDIVQGLPRIEEILEARKKSDSFFNPHVVLDSKFRQYVNQGLNLYDATRLSLLILQLYLVKELQLVYQSQGVEIADKHIEVIVRQMTSKVKIENGGDTDHLPGEIIELQKIEMLNKALRLASKEEALYYPILLGITKASLNTESFISAASFQETTKVLTDAAISCKLDWLRGLKENVIIGRLIPAGTGFNIYNNMQLNYQDEKYSYTKNLLSLPQNTKNLNFEDIIVDDRNAHMYSRNNNL
uniref:DNA-directed RNA polymerase subunit beta'' n=1 Tax=Gracilaria tenuistipitata var. liui TaxID=285951 RepID=RPOC2_GRATL|nr:RNA polymerase beta'' subunit [Gracilaria tenuistipitata var. liui]Q6B8R6.1 RecName: Full=DNA-directed RNA polymerase subunit beta''; AltName: Full=PEP; AltName: Full=Plastid-encoded RNA polymerase subunit beta''; Short=RNA polymerase subunit beta'' [Gracilaria tenuistipitata var. liui]AAT79719.1 RNA polymerase beta'' subunit [Gracilaria tenuistipitata var. liui]